MSPIAEAGSVFVSVIPSLKGFTAKVKSELRGLDITVDLDDAEAAAKLREFKKRATERDLQFKADLDTLGAERKLFAFSRAVARTSATVNVDADTGAAMAKIAGLAAFGRTAMIGSIVAPMAIQGVVGLAAALAPAVGALALLPAAAGAGALGIGTLKTAFAGFGDAIGDDPKKAADAMAKMAPSAKAAAEAVNGLKPAWHGLQLDVQGKLFDGLGTKISSLGNTYVPILRGAMSGLASDINGSVKDAFDSLSESDNVTGISTALGFVRQGVASLASTLAPLTQAFVSIFVAGAPFVAQFGSAVAGLVTRFTMFIGEASRSGQITVWIQNAIAVFRTLWGVVVNVGSILGSIFTAAMSTGGNFLTTLRMVTGELANGLKSPAGAAGLTTFFQAMHDTVAAAMPGLRVLGDTLLSLVSSIAPALPSIGWAFSMIVTSLAPFVDLVGWLVGNLLPPLMYALGFLSPALVPIAIGIGILVGIAKGWIAVQAILNGELWAMTAALLANPITWVIAAILALVGVVIYAWNNWTWFREAVTACWQGIVAAATWAWVNILQPTFAAIGVAVTAVGTFFAWLWNSVIVPAWNGIVAVITWAWTTIIWPVLQAIGTALAVLGAVLFTILVAPFVIAWNVIASIVSWAWTAILQPIWQGAIQPALQALGSFFTWLWTAAVVPAWNGIVAAVTWAWSIVQAIWYGAIVPALQFLGSIFTWLWTNIIVPAWNGIVLAITIAWGIVSGIFNAVVAFLQGVLGPIFTWLWTNIIQPVWNGIVASIRGAWDFIRGIFDVGMAAVQAVGQAFQNVADWVGRAWATIKEAARGPVQFVVDVVYNNGIRPVWNGIAGLFGLAQLGPVNLAEGGVLPGYSPGRDYIPAMLSGGEGILVPEAVRGLGPAFVGWANRFFSGGRSGGGVGTPSGGQGFSRGGVAHFADGGILGTIGDIAAGAGDFLLKLFTDPVGAVKSAFAGVLGDGARTPGTGGWTDALKAIPGKVVDAVVVKAKAFMDSMMSSGGSIGGAGVQRWSGVALQALAMAGQSPANLPILLMQMNSESGGNPGIFNNWDVNARNGTPSGGLMQVIAPTFAAYAGPLRGLGLLNPLANIYAAIKYTVARYGSLAAGWHGHGYARGGVIPGSGNSDSVPLMGTPGERVLTQAQNATFEAMLPMLQQLHAGPIPSAFNPSDFPLSARATDREPVVVNVHPRELQSEEKIASGVVRELDWQNRLSL